MITSPSFSVVVGVLVAAAAFVPEAHATPGLDWCTYLGDAGGDKSADVAFASSETTVTVGDTTSTAGIAGNIAGNFTHDASYGGGGGDGFLAKFDLSGNRLWGTYYGGAGLDYFESVAVDSNDVIIAVGTTSSANAGAVIATVHDVTLDGFSDAMLVKFSSTGTRLVSRYFGGNSADSGRGVCVTPDGYTYVVGITNSTNLGLNALHQNFRKGNPDAFVAKFDGGGLALWVNYFGGTGGETEAEDCVADAAGNVFVVGRTTTNNSIYLNGWDSTYGGLGDAFLAKFTAAGALSRGTYYGGTGPDVAHAVDLDANGNIYVAGTTKSPNTLNVIDTSGQALQDDEDAFVVRFSPTFIRHWGRYYGGSDCCNGNKDTFKDLEVQGETVLLSGDTTSADGIATPDAFALNYGDFVDGMFVILSASNGSTIYGTYINGDGEAGEHGNGVAGTARHAAVTGSTTGDRLATSGAHDFLYGGAVDAFLMIIGM
jgi:hypothetical protein